MSRADDRTTRVVRHVNDDLAARDDLDVVLLSIGDGLTVVRRRAERRHR